MTKKGNKMEIRLEEMMKDGEVIWTIERIESYKSYRKGKMSCNLIAHGRPLQVMKRLIDYLYVTGLWKKEDAQITQLIQYGLEKGYWTDIRILTTPIAKDFFGSIGGIT